ncbi:hypothetical protein [Spartinivicinus ruber]|uniref:hypothetical protein n=1 Tax=Spartinivicinus ruber TaxID=2683272 RepID=UPI0013D89AC7|nr:hypothetical protein [Spartinivicinus ruber]
MDVVAKAQDGTTLSRSQWELTQEFNKRCSGQQPVLGQWFNCSVAEYVAAQLVPQLDKQGLLVSASMEAAQLTVVETETLPPISSAEQLNYLARLHNSRVNLDYHQLAQHQWLPEYNLMLLDEVNPAKRRLIAALLDSLCYDYQHLFGPMSLIAGACDRHCWRRTLTGELMLVDLHRISLGNPALDLAATLTGLPSIDDCYQTAQTYLQVNPQFKRHINQLTADILAATVWLKVDKCRLVGVGVDNFSVTEQGFYFEQVPEWLVSLMNNR